MFSLTDLNICTYFPNFGSFPMRNIICSQDRKQPAAAMWNCHSLMENTSTNGSSWKEIRGKEKMRIRSM